MNNRRMIFGLGVVVMGSLLAAPVWAQGRPSAGNGMRDRGPDMQPGVEQLLRNRERLDLTEEQIDRLDALRREGVAHRIQQFQETADIRSRMEAGLLSEEERDALRDERSEKMEQARAMMESHREAVEAILTDDQKTQLRELRQRAMRRGGRGQMRGGQGSRMRDGGFMRGGRGRGGFSRPGGFSGRGIHRFPIDQQ